MIGIAVQKGGGGWGDPLDLVEGWRKGKIFSKGGNNVNGDSSQVSIRVIERSMTGPGQCGSVGWTIVL